MKRIMTILGALITCAAPATAAAGAETEGIGLITILLLGFGGLIVVGQLIPGVVMFYGMIKGLFSHDATKTL